LQDDLTGRSRNEQSLLERRSESLNELRIFTGHLQALGEVSNGASRFGKLDDEIEALGDATVGK